MSKKINLNSHAKRNQYEFLLSGFGENSFQRFSSAHKDGVTGSKLNNESLRPSDFELVFERNTQNVRVVPLRNSSFNNIDDRYVPMREFPAHVGMLYMLSPKFGVLPVMDAPTSSADIVCLDSNAMNKLNTIASCGLFGLQPGVCIDIVPAVTELVRNSDVTDFEAKKMIDARIQKLLQYGYVLRPDADNVKDVLRLVHHALSGFLYAENPSDISTIRAMVAFCSKYMNRKFNDHCFAQNFNEFAHKVWMTEANGLVKIVSVAAAADCFNSHPKRRAGALLKMLFEKKAMNDAGLARNILTDIMHLWGLACGTAYDEMVGVEQSRIFATYDKRLAQLMSLLRPYFKVIDDGTKCKVFYSFLDLPETIFSNYGFAFAKDLNKPDFLENSEHQKVTLLDFTESYYNNHRLKRRNKFLAY